MIQTTQEKSPVSTLLAVLLATLLLNGCSSSDNNGGNTTPSTDNTTDSFTFTTTGDIGGGTAMRDGIPITTVTLQNMAAQKAAFFLVLGDLSYSQVTPESAWCEYMQSIFGMTHPIMLETGNHENNGANGLIENFAQCLPARLPITGTYGREYYFDYPTSSPLARFIMLPAGLGKNYNNGSSDQAWLNTLIDQTRTAGIKWVIVGMHTVCATVGQKNCQSWQASAGPDLFNFLVNKKVDMVLQAHEHNYQRSKQLSLGPLCAAIPVQSDATPNATANLNCIVDSDDSLAKGAGTVFVISGITPNYQWPYGVNMINDPEAPYFKVAQDSDYGYTKVTISAAQLTSQFIRTGGTSETGGNPPVFSDSFTIEYH